MTATTLKITGMHCAGCVSSVEKHLRAVVGVEEVVPPVQMTMMMEVMWVSEK